VVHPKALPVTLAGDPGDVFGVNTDSAHVYTLCTLYLLLCYGGNTAELVHWTCAQLVTSWYKAEVESSDDF